MPASLADRRGRRSTASPPPTSTRPVENVTVVDSENESVGPTTGAPTIVTNWDITERSPVKLTSGHAPHGADEALLDADTADKKHLQHRRHAAPCIAQPGSFKVRIVGIATFTTTNPGAALVFLDTADRADQAARRAPDVATSISVDAAPGVSDDQLKQRVAAELGSGPYDVKTAESRPKSAADATRRIPRRHQVRDARLRRDRRPRRHLPDRQHLLDADRPAHPRARA